jgi:hypothetical protein
LGSGAHLPALLPAGGVEEMTRVALYAINVLIAGPPQKALMSPGIAGTVPRAR